MKFEEALPLIRAEKALTRRGWPALHQWVSLCKSEFYRPFLSFRTVGGDYVPWTATHADLLANDWEVYDGPADHEEPKGPTEAPKAPTRGPGAKRPGEARPKKPS